jgi:hypothetical protein
MSLACLIQFCCVCVNSSLHWSNFKTFQMRTWYIYLKQIPDVCLEFKILALDLNVNSVLLQRTDRQRETDERQDDSSAGTNCRLVPSEHNDFRVTKVTDRWAHSPPSCRKWYSFKTQHWRKARLVCSLTSIDRRGLLGHRPCLQRHKPRLLRN